MTRINANIAVLVSGNGTNLQALIDSDLGNGKIVLVISSVPGAYALRRAQKAGIKTLEIDRKERAKDSFDAVLYNALIEHSIDIVVLAGFLCILGEKVLTAYENKIINVHPSLLPAFGGKGYYGLKVHEAALERGVKITGATVHFVNNEIDGGKIILQKAVEVKEDDTPESLQKRVMEEAERIILPEAVRILTANHSKNQEKMINSKQHEL